SCCGVGTGTTSVEGGVVVVDAPEPPVAGLLSPPLSFVLPLQAKASTAAPSPRLNARSVLGLVLGLFTESSWVHLSSTSRAIISRAEQGSHPRRVVRGRTETIASIRIRRDVSG